MKRILAVDKEKGVFLGMYLGAPIFSKNDFLNDPNSTIMKAYTFANLQEANDYLGDFNKKNTINFNTVNSDDDYISYVDMVKQGYGDELMYMLNVSQPFNEKYDI
jgi:hypothetical protein